MWPLGQRLGGWVIHLHPRVGLPVVKPGAPYEEVERGGTWHIETAAPETGTAHTIPVPRRNRAVWRPQGVAGAFVS